MKALDGRDPPVISADLLVPCRCATHVGGRIPDGFGQGQAAPGGDRTARLQYKETMRAVLQTTDPVVLNYAANVLEQEGIESVTFDTHASVMDGSMGFLPRRLMVLDGDFDRARALLRQAVPDAVE
jgi:hypothetical protein